MKNQKTQAPKAPELISYHDATELLGVDRKTVRRYSQKYGWKVYRKVGNRAIMFERAAVEQLAQPMVISGAPAN